MGSPIMKSSQTSSPRLFVLGGKKAFGRPLSHITVGRGGGEICFDLGAACVLDRVSAL